MSFQDAVPHLKQALAHAEGGNAAKAMHHVGHALFHLKSMTSNAGGVAMKPKGIMAGGGGNQGQQEAAIDNAPKGAMGAPVAMPGITPTGAPQPDYGALRTRLAGFAGRHG